jgi:nucleotide-binding universal stress UspA family protein
MPTIVCTVLRPESERAVALAGDLAERMDMSLTLVDIRPVRPDPAFMTTPHAPHIAPAAPVDDPATTGPVPAAPPADLEALARQAGVSPAGCERMEAPPAAAIEELSARPGVELLVASDTGAGPLATAITGKPPRSSLRHLHAPLVLVQEHARRPVRLPDHPSIACAVLDDESGAPAAALAGDLADRLGATLRFVHAGNDDDALPRLQDLVRSAIAPHGDVRLEVLPREDAQDLHAWAERQGADLLVTGSPRHGALVSALLGSVVHTAAQHGEVPVVVAPGPAVG